MQACRGGWAQERRRGPRPPRCAALRAAPACPRSLQQARRKAVLDEKRGAAGGPAYMDIWDGTEEGGCVPACGGADAVACSPPPAAASPVPLDLRESGAAAAAGS